MVIGKYNFAHEYSTEILATSCSSLYTKANNFLTTIWLLMALTFEQIIKTL